MRAAELLVVSVGEIMTLYPATTAVFIARRMHCVGCPIGKFHTLPDAAREHHIDLTSLLTAVMKAMEGSPG